jgi:hypothetical protein
MAAKQKWKAKTVQARLKATKSITLRLNGQVLEQVRREAEQSNISINTMASKVFKHYVEFEGYAAKAGMVSFPKELLVRIMDRLPDDEVNKLSDYVRGNEMKDAVLMVRKEYTGDAFLKFIEAWMNACGIPYRHDIEDEKGKTHSVVIQHDMGTRWSLFLQELFKFVFEDVDAKWSDFQTTDNTLMFNVEI